MGRSRNTQTQTTQRDPYSAAVPGLQTAGTGISNWLSSPQASSVYGGPRVAQMSEDTRSGVEQLRNSTGLNQTQGYLSDVLGGRYLDAGNPHLTALQDSIRSSVMPSINGRVSSAGMAPGSSVDQQLVGREMTRAMAQPMFQTYENERGRQMQAAGMMPGVSQQLIGNRLMAGQIGEGYEQRNIDAGRQEFEERRTAGLRPYQEAMPLLGTLAGVGGTQTGTTTQTQHTPLGQQILGGVMTGAGLLGGGGFGPLAGMFGGMFGGGRQMVNGWENNDPGGRYDYPAPGRRRIAFGG